MNTNTNTPEVEITVAPVASITRHYKKSVIELYQDAVDSTIDSRKSAVQMNGISGNLYTGLNKAILNKAKAELGLELSKSNKWFTVKQITDANLVQKSEDDYGVILFSSKLKDIEGSNKKEKIITYYRVYHESALEPLPL